MKAFAAMPCATRTFARLLPAVVFLLGVSCAAQSETVQEPEAEPVRPPNLNGRRYENLVHLAQRDLGCSDLDDDFMGANYEYLGNSIHRMRGCGSRVDYVLYCPGRLCSWKASPSKQAAFEMSCPVAQLRLSEISPGVYAIEGCNQRRSYKLHEDTWIGLDVGAGNDTPSSASPSGIDEL